MAADQLRPASSTPDELPRPAKGKRSKDAGKENIQTMAMVKAENKALKQRLRAKSRELRLALGKAEEREAAFLKLSHEHSVGLARVAQLENELRRLEERLSWYQASSLRNIGPLKECTVIDTKDDPLDNVSKLLETSRV